MHNSSADLAELLHRPRARHTTHVDHRLLMHDRELLTIDVPAVVAEMGERMRALLDRSRGKRIQEYNT